ncbi:DUF4405 domain-containing protein (plasmid) [Entomospira entomophila]|uniref:DUF4405 domain-containing protein n=1 Tax=Entomospira entomophila TaxID=2719988 RepID=A0A968GB40_9SPIO|nr:DUF4405 domain-containing protein [Entomospira entomophilus]NIZ41272.1 DUF4405 domain-containing protein [Entomospira entomophilus]WDI36200.1 DUF4405 domain-containing protein [Entomospira entomophilus]
MKYRTMIPHILLISTFLLVILKEHTSMTMHIVSALMFGILVILHIMMHRKWLSAFMKNKIAKSKKNRLLFISSMILLCCTIISITSGIIISGRILPGITESLSPTARSIWVWVHIISANVMIAMAITHIVVNIKRIANWFKGTKTTTKKVI